MEQRELEKDVGQVVVRPMEGTFVPVASPGGIPVQNDTTKLPCLVACTRAELVLGGGHDAWDPMTSLFQDRV